MNFRNRDYEFEAELEDHAIGNYNVYRLTYINYHRIGEGYRPIAEDNIGVIDWPFQPFMLPDGMSRTDAFKVISYLTSYIERVLKLEEGSKKSVSCVNNALDLERLGFKKVDGIKEDEIIDLFTVTGRILLFKTKDPRYSKYFDWYTENVTLNEVQTIYANCGMNFYDLSLDELQELPKSKVRTLNNQKTRKQG